MSHGTTVPTDTHNPQNLDPSIVLHHLFILLHISLDPSIVFHQLYLYHSTLVYCTNYLLF